MTSTEDTAKADVACIATWETLRQASHRMREIGVAAPAVCRENGKSEGIVTRDMVVESIAAGGDPKTVTVGEVASHAPAAHAARQVVPVSQYSRRSGHWRLLSTFALFLVSGAMSGHLRGWGDHDTPDEPGPRSVI